jgi:hypothetical protein
MICRGPGFLAVLLRRAQRLQRGRQPASPAAPPPPDLCSMFPAMLAGQGPPSHIFELAAKAPLQRLYDLRKRDNLLTVEGARVRGGGGD